MTLQDWISGRSVATVAAVAVANVGTQKSDGDETSDGRKALSLLNQSGARLLSHRHQTVAVPQWNDTQRLRQALALLGYGSHKIVHFDTGAHRGRDIGIVEAALLDAGLLTQ